MTLPDGISNLDQDTQEGAPECGGFKRVPSGGSPAAPSAAPSEPIDEAKRDLINDPEA